MTTDCLFAAYSRVRLGLRSFGDVTRACRAVGNGAALVPSMAGIIGRGHRIGALAAPGSDWQ
jgi:hypothetical protein